jgi:hypothetical protein
MYFLQIDTEADTPIPRLCFERIGRLGLLAVYYGR